MIIIIVHLFGGKASRGPRFFSITHSVTFLEHLFIGASFEYGVTHCSVYVGFRWDLMMTQKYSQ